MEISENAIRVEHIESACTLWVFTHQYHWHVGEDSLNQHFHLTTKIAILLLLTLVTLISIFMKDDKNPRKINFPDFLTQNGNMRTRLMRCCGLLISFYKYFDLQIKPPSLYHNCYVDLYLSFSSVGFYVFFLIFFTHLIKN